MNTKATTTSTATATPTSTPTDVPVYGPTLISLFDRHDDPLEALFMDIEHLREPMFNSVRGGGPEGRDITVPENVRSQTWHIVRVLALVATLDEVPPEWVALAKHFIEALPAFGELWHHALAALFQRWTTLPPDGPSALAAIRHRLQTSVAAPQPLFDTSNDEALLFVLGELYDTSAKRWKIARKSERPSKCLWTPWGAMRRFAGAAGITNVPELGEAQRDHKAERAERIVQVIDRDHPEHGVG